MWLVFIIMFIVGDIKAQTKRTINIQIAGTLPNYISENEKYSIEELTLSGELNGTDIRLIRDMAGQNSAGLSTAGKLKILDISNVEIVAGGDYYIDTQSYHGWKYSDGSRLRYNSIFNGMNNLMFSYCIFQSIKLPSISSIGYGAFVGCQNLQSVLIPNTVSTIDKYAFRDCTGMETITIPNSLTRIEEGSFDGCTELKTVNLPNNINYIGEAAFSGCQKLTSVIIPNMVTTITSSVFSGCTRLSSIVIPNSVTCIEQSAFLGCQSLSSFTLPPNLYSIGEYAFSFCKGLATITIPNSVTSIGQGAFEYCESLSSLTLPNSLLTIEDNTFYGCTGLKSIIIPNSVISIGAFAFQDCSNISSIEIPSSVKSIKPCAFYNCNINCLKILSSYNPFEETLLNGSYRTVLENCKIGSLIWEPAATFPNEEVRNLGSNLFLYVRSSSYAPDNVRNVIVNEEASLITLSDDGGNFFCPQAFTTKMISYSHNYSMVTGGGGKGWETIVLPFDVKEITHSINGELVPFASINSESDKKPFWLYQFNGNSFQKASTIQANKPYIISMPNQATYNKEYNLSGDVTFSAKNIIIPVTPEPGGSFLPAFSRIDKNTSIKVLNVVNKYVKQTMGYEAGSMFIENLRDVLPFECYFKSSASTRSVGEMIEDD